MKILDCTLRDGGYYTNWDFDRSTVDTYIQAFNNLPVDYLEVGYRSNPMKGYLGQYFYCPVYVLERLREQSTKKLVIILDEKDVKAEDVERLLRPCVGLVDMVRMAIDPKNFGRALGLAAEVKKLGFEIGFNVMYMSKWKQYPEFLKQIKEVGGIADYFYMVDSFGGVYPQDVLDTYQLIKDQIDIKTGFHGHNNMELALINTLTAIDAGVDMVDSTVNGMGRGAGNLKTELLLTALNAKGKLDFDFNVLSKVVDPFVKLEDEHGWGTNLPYMVSGANSLPQKDVMDWVGKRFYSFNSIIRALSNQSKGIKDNLELKDFNSDRQYKAAVIVGGGPGGAEHAYAANEFLNSNDDICLIHASSKNTAQYAHVAQTQYHCLAGNEGYRLESVFDQLTETDKVAILPPYPRTMGTYLPKVLEDKAYQLSSIDFTDKYKESVTALAIQAALNMNVSTIYFIGYDGYRGDISRNELELFNENEYLFTQLKNAGVEFSTLTPSKYKNLPMASVYAHLS